MQEEDATLHSAICGIFEGGFPSEGIERCDRQADWVARVHDAGHREGGYPSEQPPI